MESTDVDVDIVGGHRAMPEIPAQAWSNTLGGFVH